MKTLLGFFMGLVTGVTIILVPIIAVLAFLAGGVLGLKAAEWADDEPDEEPPDDPTPSRGAGSPGHVQYQNMQRPPQTPEEIPSP